MLIYHTIITQLIIKTNIFIWISITSNFDTHLINTFLLLHFIKFFINFEYINHVKAN